MNSYPIGALLASAMLCQLLLAPAQAIARHAYGEAFIRFGYEQIDAAPLLAEGLPGREPAGAGREEDYLGQVTDMEAVNGPYAAGLSESLYDLGRFYQSSGDAERALAVFRRALHVVRINEGLNSPQQIPLLRSTLDTYRMSGDFEGLDDKYDYYFKLLDAGQPPHTELRLNAALAYLRWQREALRLEIDRRPYRRLFDLLRLNNELLDLVAEDVSVSGRWYSEFALSQLKNLYLLQALVEPPVQIVTNSRASVDVASPRFEEDPLLSSLQRQRFYALRTGSAILDDALYLLPPTAPAEDRGRLQLALADWHVWNEGVLRGGEHYAAVVDTLSAAGRKDLLHLWLGEQVELPDNGAYFQPDLGWAVNKTGSIELQFDVNERGKATNIMSVEQLEPEQDKEASRIMRRLRSVQFRPRWQDGFAEPADQVRRRYVWLD